MQSCSIPEVQSHQLAHLQKALLNLDSMAFWLDDEAIRFHMNEVVTEFGLLSRSALLTSEQHR
ncbi:hypothetical protein EFK26_11575 [Escherichia coli]|nr:hypothetical protein [Escherichia coli]